MPLPRTGPLLLITVFLMDLLVGMEFDLFVPSFPQLQDHFSLTPFWVEALLSINFIGYCVGLFIVGHLGDRYGRKPIILAGILTFILGSAFCLWVPYYEAMLMGRFLQGLGIAAPAILSFLIIADLYPLERQQSLFAILNGLMNFAVGAAPILGSYISLHYNWQGNFVTLFGLGIVILLAAALVVPTYKLPKKHEEVVITGYTSIFKSTPMALLIIHFMVSFVPYWIFVGMSPLLYMESLGVSLSHFGYYQGALALFFGLGNILFGLVVERLDRTAMLRASVYLLIGSLSFIVLTSGLNIANPLVITLAIMSFVLCQIVPGVILFPFMLNLMPEAKARINAIIQAGRLVLSALSLQIAGYTYDGSFQNIGILISIFVMLTAFTLWLVLQRKDVEALN